MKVLVETSARAYSDDVFHAVKPEKFVGIYPHGGLPHSRGHHGNGFAFVKPRVAVSAAHFVDQNGVLEIVFIGSPGISTVFAKSPFFAPICGVGVLSFGVGVLSFGVGVLAFIILVIFCSLSFFCVGCPEFRNRKRYTEIPQPEIL